MSTEVEEITEPTSSNLKVVIRVRPLNKKEIEAGHSNAWAIDSSNNIIYPNNSPNSRNKYAFDRIYSPHHKTKDIYNESMSPVINSFIHGFNGTIFAYGQTSSGKTYTMMGSAQNDGVIHRSIKAIFKSLAKSKDRQFALRVSYLEIYNENIKDLLNPKKQNLKISQDSFHRPTVLSLTIEGITNEKQIYELLSQGMSNRNIGATKMNDQSSRSHTIFQMHLESRSNSDESSVKTSILNIVDLAGSERAKKTDASGIRLKEGGHINKSLLTLGIVIKKLSELHKTNKNNKGEHIPYRDSKLTHILEPALGGNSKTVVICTITSADVHLEETISTLGFASRAKEVKNCAAITEFRDDHAIIRDQRKRINELEKKLYQLNNGSNVINNSNNMNSNVREEYELKINKLKSICMTTRSSNSKSVLGKRRRHSIAMELNGSPARKRLKQNIISNNIGKVRHMSYSTPMNKIKCERDDYEFKLRKVTHISKSLEQELCAKHRDFSTMQFEIDRLREENKNYICKIEFYENNINMNEKDIIIENEKLINKINELTNNNKNTIQLNKELALSKDTIAQLEEQIRDLRLDIEKNMHKMSENIRANSVETSHCNSDINLSFGLHKLHSKLILIKNDKKAIGQMVKKQLECNNKLHSEYYNKFIQLNNKLEECLDEKRLFESQYHQIREERDELRDELNILRRPENEIINELQSELLTIQQQSDIDTNHWTNTQNELDNKLIEIDSLKQLNKQLYKTMNENEINIRNELNVKLNDLKYEINNLKQLNNKLENDINNNSIANNNISNNKIDSMNVLQLKDLYKNMRKTVRELQTKMSSIERKKALHEKTAIKYTKRCNDLEQRLKLTLREHNNTKNELNNCNKEHRSFKYKYNKLQKDIKKYQNDTVNAKDLNRKLNLVSKRLESLQKKYDIKINELTQLKVEKNNFIKQINELKENLNTNMTENKKLNKNICNLENNISDLKTENSNILSDLKTEKDVVNMLQNELKKFHQINGKQTIEMKELNNKMSECNNKLNESKNIISNLNNKIIKELRDEIKCEKDKSNKLNDSIIKERDLINVKEKEIELLKSNLVRMREANLNIGTEIDETNKLLRDSQIELKENKKQLIEYQNRWQNERKENDISIEKLREFELKTNNLLHVNKMHKTSIESKTNEIDRLNNEFKSQQNELLKQIKCGTDLKIKYENCENNILKLKQENELLCDEKMRLITFKEENLKLNNKLSENKLELINLNEKIKELNNKLNNKIEIINNLNKKYELIKKENELNICNLNERENEILNLKENSTKFDKIKQELNYKLDKKIIELNNNTNTIGELRNECDELINKNKKYKQMEMEYNQLIINFTQCEKKLNIEIIKCNKINENLRHTRDKLQQITLQNERLKDNNKNENVLSAKYNKAKQIIQEREEMIENAKQTIKKYKSRIEKYENALKEWKKNTIDLKQQNTELKTKLGEQQNEIDNLRPSKVKARKFEELCKEYHRAKVNNFKASLICRETQTYQCKLPNYNKENINNINNNNIK